MACSELHYCCCCYSYHYSYSYSYHASTSYHFSPWHSHQPLWLSQLNERRIVLHTLEYINGIKVKATSALTHLHRAAASQ